MKVALISLARRGGMVHFLAELANALAPLCPTAVVCSAQADQSYFSVGVARVTVNTGQNPVQAVVQSLNPWTWIGVRRALADLDADVFHIVGVHEWNPVIALLCRLVGRTLVYTVHDTEAHPGAPAAMRAADWITFRLAHRIVVLTRFGRGQLLAKGVPPSKMSVIPHPMYTLFRRWRPRKAGAKPVVLCLGRVERYKGLEVLVRAFLSVRRLLPGWRLVLAGSGRLPAAVAAEMGRDIRILNRYLADREVAVLMHEASIVAVPYVSATQSGVIAIAQAFGRPVIATYVGGLREAIIPGKTGLIVAPNDAPALGRAIASLARDPKRLVRMQRAAAAAGISKWDPRSIARQHLRMYRGLQEREGGA